MTNNINRRVYEHKRHIYSSFTKRYNIDKFIYFERFDDAESALRREKQIKAGSGKKN
jgi:putative endonuclease